MYGGPDQIMPIASALGTIAGVAMIFWGKLVALFQRLAGRGSQQAEAGEEPKP